MTDQQSSRLADVVAEQVAQIRADVDQRLLDLQTGLEAYAEASARHGGDQR